MPRYCEIHSMHGMMLTCQTRAPLFVIFFPKSGYIFYVCARHLRLVEESNRRGSFQAEMLPYDLQPRSREVRP